MPSELDVRAIRADEAEAHFYSTRIPFLDTEVLAGAPAWIRHVDASRAFGVFEEDRVVGNATLLGLELTIPGPPRGANPSMPVAAVAGVGVHPTHRRRGLLRRLMSVLIEDAREHGEAFAALHASRATIYGRFGFGVATFEAKVVIDTRHAAFARPAPAAGFRLVDVRQAGELLPGLFDAIRLHHLGEVSRDRALWAQRLEEAPSKGRQPFTVVCDAGFVRYVRPDSDQDEVVVVDLCALDDATDAALCRFVLDLDLVDSVRFERRPLEDPLRWRLADSRQYRTAGIGDQLWLRVVDMPAAFSRRGYASSGRLVLEVGRPASDAACRFDDPSVLGVWVVEADRDGADVRRGSPSDAIDLRAPIDAVGSLYLGGVSVATLVAAGLVEEARAGAARDADALLEVDPVPFSTTGF